MYGVHCGSMHRMRKGLLHHLTFHPGNQGTLVRLAHTADGRLSSVPLEVRIFVAGAKAAVHQISVQPTSETRAELWSERGTREAAHPSREAVVAQLGDAFGQVWTSVLSGEEPRTTQLEAVLYGPQAAQRLLKLDHTHTSLWPIIGQLFVVLTQADVLTATVALHYLRFLLVPLYKLACDVPMLSQEQAGQVHATIDCITQAIRTNLAGKHNMFSARSLHGGMDSSPRLPKDIEPSRSLVLARYIGILGAVGQYSSAKGFAQQCAQHGYMPEEQVMTALIYAAVDTGQFGDAALLYLSSFDLGHPPAVVSKIRQVMVEVVYQAARQGKVHALLKVLQAKPADLVEQMSTRDVSKSLVRLASGADADVSSERVAQDGELVEVGEVQAAEDVEGLGPSAIRRLAKSLLRGTPLDSSSEHGFYAGGVDVRDAHAVAGTVVQDVHAAIAATCALAEADAQGDTFAWLATSLIRLHALQELCVEDGHSLARALTGGIKGLKEEYNARISSMAEHITGRQQAVPNATSNRAMRADGKVYVDRRQSGEGEALSAEAASAAYQRMSSAVNAGVRAMVEQCMLPAADAHGLQHAGPGSVVRARAAQVDRVKRLFGVLEMLGVQPDAGTLSACLRAAAHVRSHELMGWILSSFRHLLSPAGSPTVMESLQPEFEQLLLVPTLLRALPALMSAGLRPSHEQIGMLLSASAQTWATAQTVSCPRCGQGRESASTQAHGGQDVEGSEGSSRQGRGERGGKDGASTTTEGQQAAAAIPVALGGLVPPPVHPLSHTRLGPVAKSTVRMYSSTGVAQGPAVAPVADDSVRKPSAGAVGSDSALSEEAAPAAGFASTDVPLSAAEYSDQQQLLGQDALPVVQGRHRRGTSGAVWTPKSPLTAAQGLLQALASGASSSMNQRVGGQTLPAMLSVEIHSAKTVQCVGAKQNNPHLEEEWPVYPSKCLGILSSLGLLSTPTHAALPQPISKALVRMAKLAGRAGCSREAWAVWSTLRSMGVPAVYDSEHPVVRSLLRTFLAGGLQVPAWEAYLLLFPKRAPGPLPSLHAMREKVADEMAAVARKAEPILPVAPVATATAAVLTAALAQASTPSAASGSTSAVHQKVAAVTASSTDVSPSAQTSKSEGLDAQRKLIQQLLAAFEEQKSRATQLQSQLGELQQQVQSLSLLLGNTPADAEQTARSVPPAIQSVVDAAKGREEQAEQARQRHELAARKSSSAGTKPQQKRQNFTSNSQYVSHLAATLLNSVEVEATSASASVSTDEEAHTAGKGRSLLPVTFSPSSYINPQVCGGVSPLFPVAFIAVPRWLHDEIVVSEDTGHDGSDLQRIRPPFDGWCKAIQKTLAVFIRSKHETAVRTQEDPWAFHLRFKDAFLQRVPPSLRPVPGDPHSLYMALHPTYLISDVQDSIVGRLPEAPGHQGLEDPGSYIVQLQEHARTKALQRILCEQHVLDMFNAVLPELKTVAVPFAAKIFRLKYIDVVASYTSVGVQKIQGWVKESTGDVSVRALPVRASKDARQQDAGPSSGHISIKVVPVPPMSSSVHAEYASMRAATVAQRTLDTIQTVHAQENVLKAEQAARDVPLKGRKVEAEQAARAVPVEGRKSRAEQAARDVLRGLERKAVIKAEQAARDHVLVEARKEGTPARHAHSSN